MRVVSASHSSVLPRGPLITQWLLFSPVLVTDLMCFMNFGKLSKSAHSAYTSCAVPWTMMLRVVVSDIAPPRDGLQPFGTGS